LLIIGVVCGFFWIIGCTPEEYDVDLSYGLTHAIVMKDSAAHTGTFEFYKMMNLAMIDSGVSYDRTMDAILEATVPGGGGNGKYTIFVINNDEVKSLSLAYFGNSDIFIGVNTVVKKKMAFKLLQFYYVVGEYELESLPPKLKMDNGYEISISGSTLTGFDGNSVHIVSGNNKARNGVFHVIDGPLHPTKATNFVNYRKSYFYSYATFANKTGI
jgi:hypothetical protein